MSVVSTAVTNTFAGGPLDRCSELRSNAEWLAEQRVAPQSRIVAYYRLEPLVTRGAGGIGWLSPDELAIYPEADLPRIFLGKDDAGVAHFAVDVSSIEDAPSQSPFRDVGRFMDLRAIALRLPVGDPSTLATGKAVLDWHARHQFCAVCGTQTEMRDGGYMRKCPNEDCNAEHFPRVDPVVIMLAVRGDEALIGRQAMFPAGMYSALAGFVEPGENIEEAVRREIMEEAGIKVGAVHYHSTQPWPWPSSLMIGCFADAESTDIVIDDELEDARWASRSLLTASYNGEQGTGIILPPPMAIAHTLMKAFIEQG
ncbi:MAG: NAD(+) diphosphatase [Porticoccaceae bacterium]|nr:NAD(+) diphosphatase [Porticoccaceae bacterium]